MGFDAVYDERRRGHLGKEGNIVPNLVKLRIPFGVALLKLEAAPVTPVRGPCSMKVGSGEVAGKVLIVAHM